MTLFGPEPTPDPAKPRHGHYNRLMVATGMHYWTMDRHQRGRVGAVANRLISNGIPEWRINEESARLRSALGRPPTLTELADRLLR